MAFRGAAAEAEALFEQAIQSDPSAFAPKRQLGELYLRQKEWTMAIDAFTAALELRPDFGPVHVRLAIAYASTGDFRAALEHARKAQSLGADVPEDMMRDLERRGG